MSYGKSRVLPAYIGEPRPRSALIQRGDAVDLAVEKYQEAIQEPGALMDLQEAIQDRTESQTRVEVAVRWLVEKARCASERAAQQLAATRRTPMRQAFNDAKAKLQKLLTLRAKGRSCEPHMFSRLDGLCSKVATWRRRCGDEEVWQRAMAWTRRQLRRTGGKLRRAKASRLQKRNAQLLQVCTRIIETAEQGGVQRRQYLLVKRTDSACFK
jgi:hypothetical protein